MDAHDELDFVLELYVHLQALKLALPYLNHKIELHEAVEVLLQLITIICAADPLVITLGFDEEERLKFV